MGLEGRGGDGGTAAFDARAQAQSLQVELDAKLPGWTDVSKLVRRVSSFAYNHFTCIGPFPCAKPCVPALHYLIKSSQGPLWKVLL